MGPPEPESGVAERWTRLAAGEVSERWTGAALVGWLEPEAEDWIELAADEVAERCTGAAVAD